MIEIQKFEYNKIQPTYHLSTSNHFAMIQKKSFINAIKRALQTGTFNFIGQQTKQIPRQLFHIDEIVFDDQNWWECLPITKIDASNNEIVEIPSDIVNLPDIQLVRMKNNKVSELNVSILNLVMIKLIDLSNNCLRQLPKELSSNRTLIELNFTQNMIELIPDLSMVESLENLFISDNKLKELPNFGRGLKKLQASNNKIRYIKRSNFALCSLLQSINLNKNQIQIIQQGSFSHASNLIILQLKQNRMNNFEQVPRSQKLDTINLAFNNLKEYNFFDNSPNLTVLILSNNKITKIMKDIIKLQKLKTLDLQNNDLSQLPSEIAFINSLVRLQVQGNPLKTIRQNIRNAGTNILKKYLRDRMAPDEQIMLQKRFDSPFQQQSTLKEYWVKLISEFNQGGQLTLRNMKLTEVDSLVYGKNLKGLNLSDNQIKQLSEDIGQLTSLKFLIINKNVLQVLPASLGTIPTLQSIQAKNNKLVTFGSPKNHALNKYPSLKYLDLSGNRLNQISKTILLIKSLRTLYISYNQIRTLDEVWRKDHLPYLQILDASNNALTDLSDEVYYKGGLNFLNVENNSLTKLPTLLGFMQLSSLKVDGNPLKLIKRSVIDNGPLALLEFLRTRHLGDVPQPIEAPIQEKIQEEQPEQQWPYQGPNHRGNTNVNRPTNQQPNQQSNQQPISKPSNNFKQQYIPEQLPRSYNQQPSLQYNNQKVEPPKVSNQAINGKIKQLQKQIAEAQYQLDNNYGLSNVKKNEKRKQVNALMIEKNKLIKERDGYC